MPQAYELKDTQNKKVVATASSAEELLTLCDRYPDEVKAALKRDDGLEQWSRKELGREQLALVASMVRLFDNDDERLARFRAYLQNLVEQERAAPPAPPAPPQPRGTSGNGSMRIKASRFDDLTAFPLQTEPRAAAPAAHPGPGGGLATGPLGAVVEGAIQQVLGWKPRSEDPKGFVGALTQSFTPVDVDGATHWEWRPRTYAVQTDLSGGITGAQASLYTRAQAAVEEATPLLDGLTPLRVDVDQENMEALRALVRSQMTELLEEFGLAGGPRVVRVDQLFVGLLGDDPNKTNAEIVEGQLGLLRQVLGMESKRVNTVEEEQNLTNFRILVDYLVALRRSWEDNREFFDRTAKNPFFGTQLVLLSRQLSVVAESVDELRSALDSVFIGPAERQTLRIVLPKGSNGSTIETVDASGSIEMFLEELLAWAYDFASDEGPRIIQEGGKFGVDSTFQPVVQELARLVRAAKAANAANIPGGYKHPRVQRAFEELADHLDELRRLADMIEQDIEPDLDELRRLAQQFNRAIDSISRR